MNPAVIKLLPTAARRVLMDRTVRCCTARQTLLAGSAAALLSSPRCPCSIKPLAVLDGARTLPRGCQPNDLARPRIPAKRDPLVAYACDDLRCRRSPYVLEAVPATRVSACLNLRP